MAGLCRSTAQETASGATGTLLAWLRIIIRRITKEQLFMPIDLIARPLIAATALAAMSAAPAQAQSLPAPAPAASGAATVLEPVVVKANRETRDYRSTDASVGVLGDLKLLDTPFSLNVLTRDLLDHQQAFSYGDFLKNDPSATVGNVPVGFATLRGFSIGTDGFLFDGLSGSVALSDGRWQLEGVDRIEVLKGPSAFLYGLGAATSLGGTVNFIPKRPPSEPVRSASVGYTNRSLFSAAADLADRFGSDRQFGYRLNLGYKDGEQAVSHYGWNHRVATLALGWQVTRDLSISGSFEYARNRFPRLQPFYIVDPALTAVPQAPDGKQGLAQPWDDFATIGHNIYLRADWQLAPDWALTAQLLSSRDDRPRTKEARFGSIDDASGNTTLFGGEDESLTTGRSAQLLLHGKLRIGVVENLLTAGLTATRGENRSGANSLGLFPSNLYAPVDGAEPASPGPIAVAVTQETRASSLLISDIAKLDDRWSVLLGARHARLRVDNQDGNPIEVSKTSPTAALMFKPTPGSLVYVNYSEGLEPGGKAPTGTTNQDQLLAPIKTQQVELGAKLEIVGITATAAVFDLKKPFEYVDANTSTYVQNGIQRHRGLELTLTGSATPNLSIIGGAMFLDPTTRSTGDAATEGQRPVGVPRITANVYTDWRVPGVAALFLNAGAFYSGKQYVNPANTQAIPAWTRFDIGARYETRISSVKTTLLLGIENLADRGYWSGAQSGLLTLADPRTLKLTAKFDL
jgi:iron complex outermembrane recepter protein